MRENTKKWVKCLKYVNCEKMREIGEMRKNAQNAQTCKKCVRIRRNA